MIAAAIACTLGAARRGAGGWWSCRCPSHDDRSPSLSLRDGERGVLLKCFAGCDPRRVLAELRRRGLIDGPLKIRPARATVRGNNSDDMRRRFAMARRIWNAAHDARETPVAAYFARRGLAVPLPLSLRYVPALRRLNGSSGPAMVGRIDDRDGELVGVHRTWLDCDERGQWRRGDRAMLGRAAGSSVHLAAASETLMVGEGIETCLAAMQATAMPAWAALSTSGLAALALPSIVQTVIILADHDASGAGEQAARALAQRCLGEGRWAKVVLPHEIGTDIADLLVADADVRDVAA